jgi:hypothetical protein
MSLRQRVDELFRYVPPYKKYELFRAVVRNPSFPRTSPVFDESYHDVRRWQSETSRHTVNNLTLGDYIDLLAESSGTPTDEEVEEFKKTMYEIYIEEIEKLLNKEKFKNTLKNIPMAPEGMAARMAWNERVNLPFNSGPGRNFAAHWPKTVAPNRPNTRKYLIRKLKMNSSVSRKSRKRSKTRKH